MNGNKKGRKKKKRPNLNIGSQPGHTIYWCLICFFLVSNPYDRGYDYVTGGGSKALYLRLSVLCLLSLDALVCRTEEGWDKPEVVVVLLSVSRSCSGNPRLGVGGGAHAHVTATLYAFHDSFKLQISRVITPI